jgi:transcriptional regulator with XRE-family HTH domain
MDAKEFRIALDRLGLSQLEAARLLGVKSRTVQRWAAGNPRVGEPAAQALRAWTRLAERGIAWRPDAIAIENDDLFAGARQREQALVVNSIAKRIAARGGPTKSWRVNLKRRRAMAPSIVVMFNSLANGGFSAAAYRRQDEEPELARDWPLIEEAIIAFAGAVAAAGPNWASGDGERRRNVQRQQPGIGLEDLRVS